MSQRKRLHSHYDPQAINIRTMHIAVEQLVTRIKHDEIDLSPDFQRLRDIWTHHDKSRLIESLLLRIPIPVFYVAADENGNWSVVDGVQRLSTIDNYVSNRFALSHLEYLGRLDGFHHSDLSRPMQRRIGETQLIINIIEPHTPPEVMFNVFRRINTGGTQLNGQEIRHALYPGKAREYLKNLAEDDEFTRATGHSIGVKRMEDRECVLRFLAFRLTPPEEYSANDLDGYLTDAMMKINKMGDKEHKVLTADFKKAMRAAYDIFGRNAFRKPSGENCNRFRVNKTLFETWSVMLARCSPEQIKHLIEQREEIQHQFMQMMETDAEFSKAISLWISRPERVQKRFQMIKKLVEEFI